MASAGCGRIWLCHSLGLSPKLCNWSLLEMDSKPVALVGGKGSFSASAPSLTCGLVPGVPTEDPSVLLLLHYLLQGRRRPPNLAGTFQPSLLSRGLAGIQAANSNSKPHTCFPHSSHVPCRLKSRVTNSQRLRLPGLQAPLMELCLPVHPAQRMS